jgi:hypothetical protein
MPASAVTAPATCFDAQTQLTSAQHALAVAQQADRIEDSSVSGAADFTPDAEDQAVTADNAAVSTAQGYVNALCGTTTVPGGTGHPHPWPTPTPVPGPVGFPGGYLNCTQLANRGISNIPVGSVYYRPALDANHDGVACETTSTGVYQTINGQNCHLVNGQWVAVNNPTVVYRVVNGKMCHQVSGQWIPINQVTVAAPTPCTACAAAAPVVVSEPQTVTAPAPVYTPGPVVQGAPVYVPGPVVSVPNTSAGVNNGDGSTDDTITITIDLGNILTTTPLPTLPKV